MRGRAFECCVALSGSGGSVIKRGEYQANIDRSQSRRYVGPADGPRRAGGTPKVAFWGVAKR
jgi:hypothetical protein